MGVQVDFMAMNSNDPDNCNELGYEDKEKDNHNEEEYDDAKD